MIFVILNFQLTIHVLFSGDDSNLDDVTTLTHKLKSAIENENIRFVEQVFFLEGKRNLVVRALDFLSGSPGFDSSFLPLDGFVFGGPEFKPYTLCI